MADLRVAFSSPLVAWPGLPPGPGHQWPKLQVAAAAAELQVGPNALSMQQP